MRDLRQDALALFQAAVAAVEPARLVERSLSRQPLPAGGELALVAVGKAAAAMTDGARRALGPGPISRGVVIAPEGPPPDGFEFYRGGHPTPNEDGVRGARAIRELAAGLRADDTLLCLISGGGSALMALPAGDLTLADLRETTALLLRAGATIGELNCVRKHLDDLKGGRLAAAASPARTVALVLSDVVGDPLDVIASGPTSPDPTTFEDALAVLNARGVLAEVPAAVRLHLKRGVRGEVPESPKPGDGCFERVDARIVGNNRVAAEAALEAARQRGYRTLLLTTSLTGEAREVGRVLAALGQEMCRSGSPIAPPACLVAAGETTVHVRGHGRGGRNQELALGAALALDEARLDETDLLVASFGTDGIDGPTDAAGAMALVGTVRRARELGFDPLRSLADNDAYPFFDRLEDLAKTGPTGTNVMDLALILAG